MPYQVNRRPDSTLEITAQMEPDKVESERRQIVGALRSRVSIPGFRRGKAPLSVIGSRFAREIHEELREHLSEAVWQEVVEGEEGFEPISALRVKQAETREDGSFHLLAEVDVRPRFELPDVASLTLPEATAEVTDDEIQSELDSIREQHAAWEPADDQAAEDGMLVDADLHGEFLEGEGEPIDGKGSHFILGHPDMFPEINEALQGARVGEERTAEKRFPDDDPDPDRAGRKVRFRLAVSGLKRKVLPPIDDDLAATVGLSDLAELRERVTAALQHRKKAERRASWRRGLLDQLEEALDPMQLPPTLVRSALDEEMTSFAYGLAMRGINPDEADINWQELMVKMEPGARRKALDTLVLEQLAEAWDIRVPEEEVDAYVRSQASQAGIPPAEHKANLAKEGRLDGIRSAARLSAAVTELIRRAGGEVE